MATYEAGYDDERFQSPVPKELHCGICFNVLRKPMQCERNEHFFCNECITRHLREAQRCPNCNEHLTLQTLRPARAMKNLVAELMMKCDNSERGCDDDVKLENLEDHVGRCGFSPVHCPNEGCAVIMNRESQEGHLMDECDFRLERCRVCGGNVIYWKRELHCYVTRKEINEMKRDLKETKDEMFNVKELVSDMRREMARLTGGIVDIKDQMEDQMGEMKDLMKVEMDKMKREVAAIRKESDARSLGASSACFQLRNNIREDIIIAGGPGLLSVEMFSWTTRQWIYLSPMTSPRWFSSSFVHQDQMFVCGGEWRGNTMETLVLTKEGQDDGMWKEVQAKLPQETMAHASTFYKDDLFIFGGQNDGGKIVSDIYKVSLVSPYSAQLVCDWPQPRCYHGAQRFGDKVAIVGGTISGYCDGSLDSALLYDITGNRCRTLSPLPFAVFKMATVALADNIIIIGGRDKNDNVLNTVVSYNVTDETCEMLPSMKHERYGCVAVITRNVIVVMGGHNDKAALNSVESFSFDRYSWEELPSMNEVRYGATAIVKSFIGL